jgi:hypothetical protein
VAADNAFALNEATGVTTGDETRQRKLKSLGSLRGLFNEPTAPEDTLTPSQPLYGGEISKDTGTSEGNEPSALATERVGRAPAMQEASPLLGPEQRLGNLSTGEEGHYGPLNEEQRTVSLKDFFQPTSRGEDPGQPATSSEGGVSRDVGGSGTNQNTGLALASAKLANKTGTSVARSISDLFKGTPGVGEFSADFPGQSFAESERLAAGGFNDVGLGPTDEFGDALARGSEAAGGAGSLIGPIGSAVSAALSLASLINAMTGDQYDESRTGQAAGTAITSIPNLASLGASLAGAAPGVVSGLGGLGLAYLPLMIPAIKSLFHIGEDSLPYGASNMAQARSRGAAEEIPRQLNQYLLGQNDPNSLIALATGAVPLSPNQEVLMQANGSPWNSEPYNQLLERVLNGDPEATQQFLRSVQFTAGETGAPQPNTQLTDTYRRQLAHALGLTPEQTTGMFGIDPYQGFAGDLAARVSGLGQAGMTAQPSLADLMTQLPQFTQPDYSNFGTYSPYYRDPAMGRLDPALLSQFQDLVGQQYQGVYDPAAGSSPTIDEMIGMSPEERAYQQQVKLGMVPGRGY